MTITVLGLVQQFCDKQGLPTPSALVGVREKSVTQLRALLLDVLRELGQWQWQSQQVRKTWTSVAGQDQGALTDIFGEDFLSLAPDSLWNNTRRMRIYGPLPPQIWQALQTLPNAGPEFQCWVSGGHLYVSPAMVVGETLSGIYTTNLGLVSDEPTPVAKSTPTDDADIILYPEDVAFRCLEYKWRKAKGEPGWEDDYNTFIGLVAKRLAATGLPTLQLHRTTKGPQPGVVIPAGSWNV